MLFDIIAPFYCHLFFFLYKLSEFMCTRYNLNEINALVWRGCAHCEGTNGNERSRAKPYANSCKWKSYLISYGFHRRRRRFVFMKFYFFCHSVRAARRLRLLRMRIMCRARCVWIGFSLRVRFSRSSAAASSTAEAA